MEHLEVNAHAIRVMLNGRLDSKGVDQVETPFTALVANCGKHVLVDLGGVGFVASMAIRMLIANARTLSRRGQQMVLFGAAPLVGEVFEHVALSDLIPVVADLEAALAIVDDAV